MSTRIVFIHGMKNEKQDPAALRARWLQALKDGWRNAGVAEPAGYEVDLPYYGDRLHELTDGAPGAPTRNRGPGDIDPHVSAFEDEYLKLLKERLGIGDDEVEAELPQDVRERGPENWEWVQAIARALEKRSPRLAEKVLGLIPQVEGYLNRPAVAEAVNAIVEPSLKKGRMIVVSHSLGTVVAYMLLKKLSGTLDMPLFATIGSPLGINAVWRRARPVSNPRVMEQWVNACDERDPVALVSKLLPPNYPGPLTNMNDIHNAGDDPHAITEYLKHAALAKLIAAAV
jgi:hypothetical protein